MEGLLNFKNDGSAVIGVDLGGTKVKAGRVEGGAIMAVAANPIPISGEYDAEAVVEVVKNTIAAVFSDKVAGIGIGIPSMLDRKNGVIYDVQNIKSWKEIHLKDILEAYFQVPVVMDNDANCFAMGEKLYGQGKNYDNFAGITLGTGIGTGLINRGTLIADTNCGSGEFGEIPYLDGKLEDYASGQFFKNKLKTDGQSLFAKAQKKDAAALQAYCRFGEHLGQAIKIIMYAVDPGHFIIGGSIAEAKDFFEPAMWAVIRTFAFPKSLETLVIEYSRLGGDAPILGAAAVFHNCDPATRT